MEANFEIGCGRFLPYLPIHHSLISLFDLIKSELVTALLNKPQINVNKTKTNAMG
jgi:hypothetical protein